MGGYLKALLIAVLFPALMPVFMGLAGFLQLRSWSVSWAEAGAAASQQPLNYALVPAAVVALIFFVAFPHQRREGGLLESVHVRPLLGGIVALCFIAGLFMQLPMAEVGNLAQELWPLSFDDLAWRHRFINPTTWWAGFSALIALVMVAPLTEELLFRGWLLWDLEAQYGKTPAILWSSLLFGLVHIGGGVSAVIYATLGGLVLGTLAVRTKSTLASIAMHAGVNALPLLLPAALIRIEGFNTLSQHVEHIAWWLVLLSLGGAAAALRIVWRETAEAGSAFERD